MEHGSPAPLGATPVDGGVNFAVFSSVAESVELCLFDASGRPTATHDMPACSKGTWHGFLPRCRVGQRYGYRVRGPWRPEDGLRCNPYKLLIDPYAREIAGQFVWHDAVFDYVRLADAPEMNKLDSAPYVPKSVVRKPGGARVKPGPTIAWEDTVLYEVNLRGYTMRHPRVSRRKRGTFSGLRSGKVLKYLKSLGITSVELMPIQAYVDEHHLAKRGLRNYWGYNTVGFFAPMSRLAAGDPCREFQDMVNAIHDAGLEVILDVAFNHTAESSQHGPTIGFRGLDNHAYYRLERDDAGAYVNDTGTGNTLNADHPRVQALVIDALRYWSGEMGVDGFRFDLAPVLGRHAEGFSSEHPLLISISEDSQLRGVKLIAEPWDPGPGGYQLGHFPGGWAEWNDRFRDSTRRFWRGDPSMNGEFAHRLHGSADLFDHDGRAPYSSVNFVTSHDGYTLADLVSYEHRHTEANGENNRDGHAHNYSCNHGVEGETRDVDINAARRRHQLNLLATLFFSQGTPMLLAGDEFGNSQQGNNNAYAQDNDIGWLDWSGLSGDPGFTDEVRELIQIRKGCPLLRVPQFIHGETSVGDSQMHISWLNSDGDEMDEAHWAGPARFKVMYAESSMAGERSCVAILVNNRDEQVEFRLPNGAPARRWRVAWSADDAVMGQDGYTFVAPARSISLLASD